MASWKVWGLRERASLLVRLCCGPRAGGFAAPALSVGCARNQEGALLPNQEELALALLVHLPGAKTLLGTFSSLRKVPNSETYTFHRLFACERFRKT